MGENSTMTNEELNHVCATEIMGWELKPLKGHKRNPWWWEGDAAYIHVDDWSQPQGCKE